MENEIDENVAIDTPMLLASYDYYDTYQQQIISQQNTIIENQNTQIGFSQTILFALVVAFIVSILRKMIRG